MLLDMSNANGAADETELGIGSSTAWQVSNPIPALITPCLVLRRDEVFTDSKLGPAEWAGGITERRWEVSTRLML